MKNIALLLLLLFVSPAFAGIYLEPYLGYEVGTVKFSETVSGVTVSEKQNEHGVLFGGRLGLSFLGLAVGADYMGGSPTSGGSASPLQDIGAFVGFTFPVFLKASATYILSSQLTDVGEIDASNVETKVKAKGKGMKFTLGFTFLPLVVINLEYIKHTWDDIPLVSTVTAFKLEDSAGMISLSLPLDF